MAEARQQATAQHRHKELTMQKRYVLAETPATVNEAEVLWSAQMLAKHGQEITVEGVARRIGADETAVATVLDTLSKQGTLTERK